MSNIATNHPNKSNIGRPTESKALSIIAREARRLGLTEFQLLSRKYSPLQVSHSGHVCPCLYCRMKRSMDGQT